MASLTLQVLSVLLRRLEALLFGPRPRREREPGVGLPAYIEVFGARSAERGAGSGEPARSTEPTESEFRVPSELELAASGESVDAAVKIQRAGFVTARRSEFEGLAGMGKVLERIRRGDRGADLDQILGSLGQMLPLLHGADIPAHKLHGLEQSLHQMRAATRGAAGGFEVTMAWQLLERDVQAVVQHLG